MSIYTHSVGTGHLRLKISSTPLSVSQWLILNLFLYVKKTPLKISTLQRAQEIAILFLFICLLVYRLLSLTDHGFVWLLAFLCESWFAFNWVLTLNTQWTPVEYKTYPQNLLQQMPELPAVDMFVTTADAELEPPIITVNTVLSLLAVDYPSPKLACYVSDDGCSPLTLYSLTEASKFAQFWVPFCKKYNIQVRAPFRYFSGNSKLPSDNPIGFLQEWTKMKDEYQELCQKIEVAVQDLATLDFSGDYVDFAHIDRRNHPTTIKVIWENKERLSNGLPHLVYVAREKRPNYSHHYKAGAMNALTRVSGVMTNAPFMLNVDCDMYANNSKIVLCVCLLLGFKHEKEGALVQYPQMFYNTLKDDPFGNNVVLPIKTIWTGYAGIQGPLYAGSGCFHRRKVIYGWIVKMWHWIKKGLEIPWSSSNQQLIFYQRKLIILVTFPLLLLRQPTKLLVLRTSIIHYEG